MAEFRRVTKNQRILEGMEQSLKNVGRPKKLSEKQIIKAYKLWKNGNLTQSEIAKELGVSIRTINRNFKKLESEDSVHRK